MRAKKYAMQHNETFVCVFLTYVPSAKTHPRGRPQANCHKTHLPFSQQRQRQRFCQPYDGQPLPRVWSLMYCQAWRLRGVCKSPLSVWISNLSRSAESTLSKDFKNRLPNYTVSLSWVLQVFVDVQLHTLNTRVCSMSTVLMQSFGVNELGSRVAGECACRWRLFATIDHRTIYSGFRRAQCYHQELYENKAFTNYFDGLDDAATSTLNIQTSKSCVI